MGKVVREFRAFIQQGSFIDLALAVIVGGAFVPVVNAFVNDVFMALVAAVFGKPNFDAVGRFTVNGAVVSPGMVVTALLNFLVVMLAAFLLVKGYNAVKRTTPAEEAPAEEPEDVQLLREIRDLLARRS